MKSTVWVALFALLITSCVKPDASPEPQAMTAAETREYQIQLQRERLEHERFAIQSFIDSSDWAFEDYGNGLWISKIVDVGCTQSKDTNDATIIHDVLMSLGGVPYTGHSAREFPLLRDQDVAWGIQQAILGCCPGDSLAIIIPTHLAHGVAGDMANVPPMSTVLCYLRILK